MGNVIGRAIIEVNEDLKKKIKKKATIRYGMHRLEIKITRCACVDTIDIMNNNNNLPLSDLE